MLQKKITVYVTSIIYFKEKSLSYSKIRSLFSPKERITQTIETIKSIRKHIPDAHIIFLEAGMSEEWLEIIKKNVDKYIYAGKKKYIRYIVDSPYKWAWEIVLLLYWLFHTKTNESEYISKISWRYFLNENFNEKFFFHLKKFSFHKTKKSYSTRFYGLHKAQKAYRIFIMYIWLLLSFSNISIEIILYYLIPNKKVVTHKTLWISGTSWVDGMIIKE